MGADPACSLCRPDLGLILAESVYWRLVLNTNQRFLGACFWVLKRHEEAVVELHPGERIDLQWQINLATEALKVSFQPDHFNYAFLQNQDRHVHMHIYPRYASQRTFDGIAFDDPDYPSHYSVPGVSKRLSAEQYERIAGVLRSAF
jgi:diadenosine tetraphosphate (Ap4A) HIT family hydrolase